MTEQTEICFVAADVGGTKTDVGLYRHGAQPELIRAERYASAAYDGIDGVVGEFLGANAVSAAVVAAAGPVADGEIRTTNLPWRVSSSELSRRLGGAPVRLLNDLEATAFGVLALEPDRLHTLKAGTAKQGNRAILAPGTGLGQALLFWNAGEHKPQASEGGHSGFAPRDDEQIELLKFLQRRVDQVSYEHALSGPGLRNLFEFARDVLLVPLGSEMVAHLASAEDPSALIGQAAVEGKCEASRRSVELFARILLARAGDVVLSSMATGGIYLAGGILPKLWPLVRTLDLESAFVGRGPISHVLAEVPVWVVDAPKAALLGAAHVANRMVG